MQVGQATRGQRGAAGGKLQEGFPLVRRHSTQNSDEAQETGTETEDRGINTASGFTEDSPVQLGNVT